jgi:hypothetical protein
VGRREDIEARMRALEAERAQLDRYGSDIYDDGDVIKFVKSFKATANPTRSFVTRDHYASDIVSDFTYVALKTRDWWYPTGKRGGADLNGCTWDKLVEFMYTGIPVDHITIVIAEDFRTREELERELEKLAKNFDLDKALELPEVSVRRGGIRFPVRLPTRYRGAPETEYNPEPEPVKDDDIITGARWSTSGEEQADTIKSGGWCAPAEADLRLVDVEDNENTKFGGI